MRLQRLLETGKIEFVSQGSFRGLKFPTREITSIPDWKKDRESAKSGDKVIVSNRREEAGIFIDGKGKINLTTDKSGKTFKDIEELIGWLNKNKFTQFVGIDDTV